MSYRDQISFSLCYHYNFLVRFFSELLTIISFTSNSNFTFVNEKKWNFLDYFVTLVFAHCRKLKSMNCMRNISSSKAILIDTCEFRKRNIHRNYTTNAICCSKILFNMKIVSLSDTCREKLIEKQEDCCSQRRNDSSTIHMFRKDNLL